MKMSNIKFRGKTVLGDWKIGSLIRGMCEHGKPIILTDHDITCLRERTAGTSLIPIDRETVGQYVGLTDRNGKEIFEGDILEGILDGDHPENVTRAVVIWSGFGWATKQIGLESIDYLDDTDAGIWEIKGNRWDNPEMMEAEHEDRGKMEL